jgi:hypothetical protein
VLFRDRLFSFWVLCGMLHHGAVRDSILRYMVATRCAHGDGGGDGHDVFIDEANNVIDGRSSSSMRMRRGD